MNYQEFLNRTKLTDNEIINLYQYGSRVYGNFTQKSDYDFIAIVKNKTNDQFSDNKINVNFFDEIGHKTRLLNHEISALECQFLNKEFIWKESKKFDWKLDLQMLRHSLSAKSSNSWVKAKKKLTIPADYDLDIGRKSLWHSIRIIKYGIQIGTIGKIYNYAECNELYKEIINIYDWEDLFEKYKQDYNHLLTEFRKIAPK